MSSFSICANLVDVHNKEIYPAEINVQEGKIQSIIKLLHLPKHLKFDYIFPGFIDSHVHIESSMLVPSEFARLAVVHGTVGTVSDPHEIANVCGIAGVEFMIKNGNTVPFKFNFGAPSCVPATSFESAGAALNATDVEKLLQRSEIKYLSEMMNVPGVLNKDEEVLKKIAAAIKLQKPVDGHAPGLRGEQAKIYIEAASKNFFKENVVISTDHECFTKEEALEKLNYGMKIIIREGSAAKNFEALIDLLHDFPNQIMFCSDDKHPDSLVRGHINQLCTRAVAKGVDIFKILQAACVNPVLHYKLDIGLLREGDIADFVIVKDLKDFEVRQTYINGELVADNGKSLIITSLSKAVNNFSCDKKVVEDFTVSLEEYPASSAIMEAMDGQLITNKLLLKPSVNDRQYVSDINRDILKIVVVNRYKNSAVAKAFIKNFNLKQGAIASSVAHDSHNIVAIGVDDDSLCKAVNMIIENRGGISCINKNGETIIPLPVAGLMTNEDGYKVAMQYSLIDKAAKEAGSTLASPFMTLSFMALLVIPHVKLSDRGLFDGDSFQFV